MLESPTIPLDQFSVSLHNGFLPTEPPLQHLPDPYYAPWESVMADLPDLISTGYIRREVLRLPVLSTDKLYREAEWQRAYLILAFLTHAYIWGGKRPEDRLPPSIACPILEVSTHLELPPCATYAALNLWNFATVSETDADLTNPDNLALINSLTGTDDERWFLVISVAMEACGAKTIPLVLNGINAVEIGDNDLLVRVLNEMTACIEELGCILERMYERNRPAVFYHQIRPLLAGSKNMTAAGLPNGVFYDIGDGKGDWHQYSGGSNAQSSLIQLFDIAFGIEHLASGEVGHKEAGHRAFMQEMRNYMPGPHRRFLEYIGTVANIRQYAMSLPASSDVRQTYNTAVMKLGGFRDKHIQIVTRYIIMQARKSQSSPSDRSVSGTQRLNLASATSACMDSKKKEAQVFYGTGGTALIPFLKATRDETKAAARFVD
ncbi:Indoleamine 2,3-dioxygenase [Talaromyces proteolyticus]|uniref:Indoleamine 2,3-dioxygenase n=1 Tax=Talaromyces proteolyticus TaxID=1131652 RepID=A0AAD4L4Q5_9EURO|nr:Indoleamine 2,3-dioxygenase [Talaromyces proteolyticus]KAH8704173.1 Indoleamine 2,3-dioxygenase [Talaromyces proteolyticus]